MFQGQSGETSSQITNGSCAILCHLLAHHALKMFYCFLNLDSQDIMAMLLGRTKLRLAPALD